MTEPATRPTILGAGDHLPALGLRDDADQAVHLRDLVGRTVVLYFYPRDDTPGCTTQACALRDAWDEFATRDDVALFGVSADDGDSHRRFRARHQLPFPLLVDTGWKLADAFGLRGDGAAAGEGRGVERSTVVAGPDGRVRVVRRGVHPDEHLDWLRSELGMTRG